MVHRIDHLRTPTRYGAYYCLQGHPSIFPLGLPKQREQCYAVENLVVLLSMRKGLFFPQNP